MHICVHDDNLPQKVKVNGGELGLNQSPETPEEMRNLDNEKKEGRRREGDERRGGGGQK